MLLTYGQERSQRKSADATVGTGLLDLPTELLIEILKYLQSRDILRCQSVCRALRDIVAGCVELQYIIELAADNLVDGTRKPGSPSTAERLKLLLDRRRRWRELDWTQKVVVPIPGQCQAYEFVGGTFAKSMGTGDNWTGSKHLNVTWLPTRDGQARSLVREDLGVPTRDFAVDPSQDMIALVEMDEHHFDSVQIKVHIRTISKNQKHPLAAKECLTAPIPFQVGTCFIQIVGDVVGMFFWLHGPGLLVWNWRSGEMLVVCYPLGGFGALPLAHLPPHMQQFRSGFDLPPGAWDFAFLSNRAFFLTSTNGSGAIELFTFGPESVQASPPKHVATLRLPEVKEGRAIGNFSTHSSPFLGVEMTDDVPFTASQEDRVHVMTLTYGERQQRFHLFVKNSFLLSLISDTKKTLDWKDWGPKNTRFFEHNVQFQWLRYVHGQRVILPPVLPTAGADVTMMFVLDFNVHPRRRHDPARDLPVVPQSHTHDHYVSFAPSAVEGGTLFKSDVVTELPYTVSHRTGALRYTGFMIDDQRIIGMKVRRLAKNSVFCSISEMTTGLSICRGQFPGH
ncbi:uncharacterized protein PHACADRAFT_103833 [Phanerochaete carnosa HHB-10118-sp]|uniref:F-box domain-containing protein n=1 Tax=Phanerochaete carnosa (strain HHB-10118-sp) TaxID=650164 RepID=K5VW55_PHACS|nr:uncharacterized protein PHACADRAFT_103833 [Phanerochaete carnosa HHB-10118-sp]EKM51060.1 hypothetical protein PHACADRAFT_103833 [Phanerochaete carnosa HHB-10118-sp]